MIDHQKKNRFTNFRAFIFFWKPAIFLTVFETRMNSMKVFSIYIQSFIYRDQPTFSFSSLLLLLLLSFEWKAHLCNPFCSDYVVTEIFPALVSRQKTRHLWEYKTAFRRIDSLARQSMEYVVGMSPVTVHISRERETIDVYRSVAQSYRIQRSNGKIFKNTNGLYKFEKF